MASAATPRRPRGPALLLGLALGGFFDGIVLHQVLQWHHLLSNVDGPVWRDLRMQVLADGLFHALMYVVAVAGLVMLWRRRDALAMPRAGRGLAGHALLGFGGWHALDAVLSHWLTGIHRIRVDSPNPLFWDLLWLAAFGIVPLAIGLWLLRRPHDDETPGRGRSAAAALGALAIVAAPIAALPPTDSDELMVLFAPGVSSVAAFEALAKIDARVTWVDASGSLWSVRMSDPGSARSLYGQGALLVSNSAIGLGCVSWMRKS